MPGAATPDARRTRNGCRAYAGRHPGEGRPKLFQRCPAPARAQRRTMKDATEKRASATGQAVETPEGGRHLMRTTNVSRHRRAASRSGGAMSAECDGRPVYRRNGPKGAAAERGSPPAAGAAAAFSVSRSVSGSDQPMARHGNGCRTRTPKPWPGTATCDGPTPPASPSRARADCGRWLRCAPWRCRRDDPQGPSRRGSRPADGDSRRPG
jgi:hypothetical protein